MVNDLRDRLFDHRTVNHVVRQPVGHNIPEQCATNGRLNDARSRFGGHTVLDHLFMNTDLDARLQVHRTTRVGTRNLFGVSEDHSLAFDIDALSRHVIKTQNHVLRRNNNGVTRRGRQNVIRRHHQGASFKLRFNGQRHVNSHLIAIEVGIVSRTNQRVELNRLAFDQHRLKRLDA